MSLPIIDSYDVRRLSVADAVDLQALYERCGDYHQQHERWWTRRRRAPGFVRLRRSCGFGAGCRIRPPRGRR